MKPKELVRLTRLCFPDISDTITKDTVQSETIQPLWAGMGHIYKVQVSNNKPPLVIKHIKPPRQLTSLGDRRKADSYVVEANFYEKLVPSLIKKGVDLATPYYIEHLPHNETIICMSYIQPVSYYTHQMSQDDHCKAVLKWLASFHAAYWGKADEIVPQVGLQPIGSYWYLETRQEEHASMSHKGWKGRLKLAAQAIDWRLRQDPYQCLIHGDAKEANVIPMAAGQVAMCDFQYVGKGTPAKDLAYFFCGEVDDSQKQVEYLQYYLQQLRKHLPDGASTPSPEELQESLDLAYCDFCRFLLGWGHTDGGLKRKVLPLLDRLDGGNRMDSEQDYMDAMEREFGV